MASLEGLREFFFDLPRERTVEWGGQKLISSLFTRCSGSGGET